MYAAQPIPNGADSATINPAALNPELLDATSRGIKRGRSPQNYPDEGPLGSTGEDGSDKPRKRGRPMKSRQSGGAPEPATQAPVPPSRQTAPPQTPQSQNAPLPVQTPTYPPAPPPPQSSPPKPTPTKSTLKALPTVRDHTTDQLGPGNDEYLPREIDEAGEKKVLPNGQLTGGREYRCRTFFVPHRGEKLFMLATECARVLGYRDSYLLFNKNRSLYKIIASQEEKDDLVNQEILPFSYRSRQIAIVTARSMFRQFGSRVITNGRRVRDDYWESKARKQGFTEADPAGEKRPGASKAREAEANHTASMLGAPHGEIVYSTNPGQFGGGPQPQLVQPGMLRPTPGSSTRMPVITLGPDYNNTHSRDYSNILKTGPRQEITGPAYQDRLQPTPITELHAQAHHAAEFNRSVNSQRDMRNDYMQNIWRRQHDQPTTTTLSQPVGTSEAPASTSRPAPSTHTTTQGIPQPGIISNQSPQLMMSAAPYSQPVHAPTSVGPSGPGRGLAQDPSQSSSRPTYPPTGSTGTLPPTSQNYSYPQTQMWPPTPQTPQHGYSAYTAQSQPSPHPQQSPAPQLRHSSTSSQVQQPGGMSYPGMPGMNQGYSTSAQGMYSAEQTPRQYMHQSAPPPAVTQAWSQQQTPAQWWTNQPQ